MAVEIPQFVMKKVEDLYKPLFDAINELKGNMKVLKDSFERINANQESMESKLPPLARALIEIKERLGVLEKTDNFEALNTQIKVIENKLDKNSSDIDSLKVYFQDKCKIIIENQDSQSKILVEKQDAQSSQIEKIQEMSTPIHDRIIDLEKSSIEHIKKIIDTQEASSTSILNAIETNLKRLEDQSSCQLNKQEVLLSNEIKNLSSDLLKISEEIKPLQKILPDIQTQLQSVEEVVNAIYKPPKPVAVGDYVIDEFNPPSSIPVFDAEENKTKVLAYLSKYLECAKKENAIGADLIAAGKEARDNIFQEFTQRGPIMQYFVHLENRLKPMFNKNIPLEILNLIQSETQKAIAFYSDVSVKK